jgi:VanZ family protein
VQPTLKRRIWDWLPVLLWLGVLIFESTDLMSSQHTGGLLHRLVTRIFGHINVARFEEFHHVLRKTGHFLGYGMLCLLLFRALRDTFTGTIRRWTGLAIALTFLVASMDEIHQRFIPSRGGHFQDVLLDTAGAACLQVIVLLVLRRRGHSMQSLGLHESSQNANTVSGSSR